MRNNKRDYKALEGALKKLDRLTKLDLDDLLRLSSGANNEVITLRHRIVQRLKFLKESDPSCI